MSRKKVDYEAKGRAIFSYLVNSGRQMTAQELANMFGLKSKTIARKIVKEMRFKGALICSNHDGYYYSTDEKDVKETVQMLEAMANGLQTTVTSLNNAYRQHRTRKDANEAVQQTLF